MNYTPYDRIDTLANYYFEDSYVLAIHVLPGQIIFHVDAVLTDSHPSYTKPSEDEAYCFRHVNLVFDGVESIKKLSLEFSVSIDADNEKDMGNIDSFMVSGGNLYRITGPWGIAEFVANHLEINLL